MKTFAPLQDKRLKSGEDFSTWEDGITCSGQMGELIGKWNSMSRKSPQIHIEASARYLKWIYYHSYEVEALASYAGRWAQHNEPCLRYSKAETNTTPKPEAMQCTSIENRKYHRHEMDQPRRKT